MPELNIGPILFDTSKKSHVGVAIGLLSLLTFEIASMGSPTMVTASASSGSLNVYVGAFQTDCDGDSCTDNLKQNPVRCTNQDGPWVSFGKRGGTNGEESDCSKALVHKCQASQFFLIVGFLLHMFSLPTPFIPKVTALVSFMPNFVGILLTALSSFSYFLVWCIWAYLNNTKNDSGKSSCGLKSDSSSITLNYGGAFACTIIAWLIVSAQLALFVIGRNDGVLAYGQGKAPKSKGVTVESMTVEGVQAEASQVDSDAEVEVEEGGEDDDI